MKLDINDPRVIQAMRDMETEIIYAPYGAKGATAFDYKHSNAGGALGDILSFVRDNLDTPGFNRSTDVYWIHDKSQARQDICGGDPRTSDAQNAACETKCGSHRLQ